MRKFENFQLIEIVVVNNAWSVRMSLGKDLVATIGSKDLRVAAEGVIEAIIDQGIPEGLIKDIPVIGTILALGKAAGSVRDYLLGRKVIAFLSEVSRLSAGERARAVDEIAGTESKQEKLGNLVIELLDKADSDEKPRLIGRLFVAVGRGLVPSNSFARLATMINGVFIEDLKVLAATPNPNILAPDRRFAMQSNGFLLFSIKNPINSRKGGGASVLDMAQAIYEVPFELKWRLSEDATTILTHCFGPAPSNPAFDDVAH